MGCPPPVQAHLLQNPAPICGTLIAHLEARVDAKARPPASTCSTSSSCTTSPPPLPSPSAATKSSAPYGASTFRASLSPTTSSCMPCSPSPPSTSPARPAPKPKHTTRTPQRCISTACASPPCCFRTSPPPIVPRSTSSLSFRCSLPSHRRDGQVIFC